MRTIRLILAVTLVCSGLAYACDFQIDPAAAVRFYRTDGWVLPPIERGKLTNPVIVEGPGQSAVAWKLGPGPIQGLTTRVVIHEGSEAEPNLFDIPRQEFERNGKRQILAAQMMVMDHWTWRYDIDGKVVAYTVGLTPVFGHRENGKWKTESEVGCIFYATFVDDRGDGVFRLLAPGWMVPELIPGWVKDSKKSPA